MTLKVPSPKISSPDIDLVDAAWDDAPSSAGATPPPGAVAKRGTAAAKPVPAAPASRSSALSRKEKDRARAEESRARKKARALAIAEKQKKKQKARPKKRLADASSSRDVLEADDEADDDALEESIPGLQPRRSPGKDWQRTALVAVVVVACLAAVGLMVYR